MNSRRSARRAAAAAMLSAVLGAVAGSGVARAAAAVPAPVPAASVAGNAPGSLGAPIEIVDDRGVVHRLARPARRIVSLLPSLTEAVCALDACDRLVGVDRWSNWPAEVRRLPRLGGIDDAPVERIVSLRADVVLASTSSRALERLEALGVRVVRLRSDTHADARDALRRVATLLGSPARGDAAWAAVERELDAAAASVPPSLRGLRVLADVGGGTHAAGPASFLGQTLARFGLVNVVPASMGPFPRLGQEFLLRAQPQVVVGSAAELQTLAARPGASTLPALHDRRVCAFAPAEHDVLVRPGPRLGEAARLLAGCLRRIAPATVDVPVGALPAPRG